MPATVEPPPLLQFVLLSMLLHVLVIVLIGNQPGGARRGEGWLGPLDVTLRRLAAEPRAPLGLAPSEERGAAARRRSEGPSEKPGVVPPSEKPEPAPVEPPRLEMQAPEAAERELLRPPAIEQLAPSPREREIVPPVSLPLREAPEVPAVRLEKIAPGRLEPNIAPPVEMRPRERPIAPSALIEKLVPLQPERPLAPPVALPPREVPRLPSAPVEQLVPLQPERPLAPPVALPPREVPQLPGAPVERLVPTPSEREIAPPVELPPREATQPPSAPMERIAPRAVEHELAPAAPAIVRPAPAAPPGEAGPAQARPEVAPEERLPPLWFAPRPDESMFKPRRDVVTPPSQPGELPHIDREAARQRAREIASGGGSRGVINLPLPVPPEKKTKEARAIEKTARPDCRTEYADLGLLAVPALLANAITDTGCKW